MFTYSLSAWDCYSTHTLFFHAIPLQFSLVGWGEMGWTLGSCGDTLFIFCLLLPSLSLSSRLCSACHILFMKESSSLIHYLYFVQYGNFLYARKTLTAYYICQNVPFKTISGSMNDPSQSGRAKMLLFCLLLLLIC